MNLLRRINLLQAAVGVAVGAATVFVIQSSLTAQQNEPTKATYQIAPLAQAEEHTNTFRVWRLNTATGGLELCRVTNWIRPVDDDVSRDRRSPSCCGRLHGGEGTRVEYTA